MLQIRFAIRSLMKTPIVTAIAVWSVALGIGAGTRDLDLSTLLRRCAVAQEPAAGGRSGCLAREAAPSRAAGPATATPFSATRCSAISSALQTSFTGIAAHTALRREHRVRAASRKAATAQLVSGSAIFAVLGIGGRSSAACSDPDDERRARRRACRGRLSDDYWRRRFGARTDVIDQTLIVNGQALTIVGVAPRGIPRHDDRRCVRWCYVPISMREVVDRRDGRVIDDRRALLDLPVRAPQAGDLDRAGGGKRSSTSSLLSRILSDVEAPLADGHERG